MKTPEKSAAKHRVNKGVFWPRSSPREKNIFTLWGGMRTFCVNNWQSKALRFCSFHYPSSREGEVVYTQRQTCLRSRSSKNSTDTEQQPHSTYRKQSKTFPAGAFWARITKMWRISGEVVSGRTTGNENDAL